MDFQESSERATLNWRGLGTEKVTVECKEAGAADRSHGMALDGDFSVALHLE